MDLRGPIVEVGLVARAFVVETFADAEDRIADLVVPLPNSVPVVDYLVDEG